MGSVSILHYWYMNALGIGLCVTPVSPYVIPVSHLCNLCVILVRVTPTVYYVSELS